MKDHVCVAAVAGAFGVKGEVRLKPFTADPESVAAYGPLVTEDGRAFTLRIARAINDGVAVWLSGVATREQAEALKGTRLYAPRAALPPPEDEDEFYHADLIGLQVVDLEGHPLGRVRAVHDYGAGDFLEVIAPGRKAPALLPFTREAVPRVEIKAGRIVADPPAGVFDEEGGDEPEV